MRIPVESRSNAVNAKQPLTADQKSKALDMVKSIFESAKKEEAAAFNIYNVLTMDQRQQMMKPPDPAEVGTAGAPGQPPPGPLQMIDPLIASIEKKAGSKAADPQAAQGPVGPGPVERFSILNGLTRLDKAGSLSAEQSRTILDNIKIIKEEMSKETKLEEELGALLTQEQKAALNSRIPQGSTVTAWLLITYLEGK